MEHCVVGESHLSEKIRNQFHKMKAKKRKNQYNNLDKVILLNQPTTNKYHKSIKYWQTSFSVNKAKLADLTFYKRILKLLSVLWKETFDLKSTSILLFQQRKPCAPKCSSDLEVDLKQEFAYSFHPLLPYVFCLF